MVFLPSTYRMYLATVLIRVRPGVEQMLPRPRGTISSLECLFQLHGGGIHVLEQFSSSKIRSQLMAFR
jgi:hypothetical protein